jgi:hypothetical protein
VGLHGKQGGFSSFSKLNEQEKLILFQATREGKKAESEADVALFRAKY